MKIIYNERSIRLECLRLAALLTTQLKAKQDSVVGVAEQFLAFIKAGDGEEDSNSDAHDYGPDDRIESQHVGRFTPRELRRGAA
jgi:hypothetical protein